CKDRMLTFKHWVQICPFTLDYAIGHLHVIGGLELGCLAQPLHTVQHLSSKCKWDKFWIERCVQNNEQVTLSGYLQVLGFFGLWNLTAHFEILLHQLTAFHRNGFRLQELLDIGIGKLW